MSIFEGWGKKSSSNKEKEEIAASEKISAIPIYEENAVPNLEGFEEMSGYAIDAYPYQRETGEFGPGDFSESARGVAVRTVAHRFGISNQEALDQFEICIVPGAGFHGKIMAKRK